MTITKLNCIFFVFMILGSSLIYFAYAQNDVTTQDSFPKIDDLDDLLNTTVTATLTGLSLAGAAFLVRTFNDKEDEPKRHTRQAQKNFIKAFFMFLICTISIFAFDFLEIINRQSSLYVIVPDIIITYGFFGAGIMYIIKSAREIYIIYGK